MGRVLTWQFRNREEVASERGSLPFIPCLRPSWRSEWPPAPHDGVRYVQSAKYPLRIFLGSAAFVQVTARNRKYRPAPSSCRSQSRGAPITAILASFSRGISPRMSSRISVASGHPGPEHSTSTWRRSSSASGHRIRLVTRPPSTRKMMGPRKDTRCGGLTLRRTRRAAGLPVWRKRARAARPSRE
jgi:hypothetical protein